MTVNVLWRRLISFRARGPELRAKITCRSIFVFVLLCSIDLSPTVLGQTADLEAIRMTAKERGEAAALNELEAYLAANSEDVEAMLLKGVLLTRSGKHDDAISQFAALAESHPELPEPLNNLAVLYAAGGRFDDARQTLLKAVGIQPDYDTAHENLGDVYAKLANLSYEEAYQLNIENIRAKEKADWMLRILDTEESTPKPRDQNSTSEGELVSTPPPSPGSQAAPANLTAQRDTEAAPGKDMTDNRRTNPVADRLGDCISVRGITSESDAASISRWFENQGVRPELERGSTNAGSVRYSVYVPPFASRAAAENEVAKLKGKGLTDLVRIAKGKLANAISVGVFSTPENAQRRAAQVSRLGYEVKTATRSRSRATYNIRVESFEVKVLAPQFRNAFPRYAANAGGCG